MALHRTSSRSLPACIHSRGTQIEYKGKGYFSGKSHSFKAGLSPPGTLTPKHTFEGTWHQTSKDVRTGALFTDVTGPKEEVTTKEVEDQDEWESRRLWRWVAKGIRDGDFDAASKEKSKIEVRVRGVLAREWAADRWGCRTSRGSGGKTRRLLGRRGSSSTLTTSTPTRSVSAFSLSRRCTPRSDLLVMQTNAWASCSRRTRRRRTRTSTRATTRTRKAQARRPPCGSVHWTAVLRRT